MGPLRNIRLSRGGALILAAVSLAATIIILAGGGNRTDAQLAAETALKHPLRSVEQLQTTPAASSSASPSTGASGGGSDISPPAADSGSAAGNSGNSGSSSSGSSGVASAGSGSGVSSSSPSSNDTSSSSSSSQTTTTATTTTPAATNAGLPKVGHVFLLTLSARNDRDAFAAAAPAPYLRSLVKRGTLLSGFHALGRNGLADLLAMVSGQPPNRDTAAGCETYVAYPQSATLTAAGVAKGTGCIYPDAALTIADQVNSAGKTWGAYVADEGASNCPVPSTGEALDTPLDGTQAGYDVAHNPFAFFGSLLDEGGCSEYDEDLTNLNKALAKKSATPNLTYLSGDACVDADPKLAPATAPTTTTTTSTTDTSTDTTGTDAATTDTTATTATTASSTETSATTTTTTASPGTGTTTTATSTVPARLQAPAAYGCPAGETAGIAGENDFLATWVPKILASAAYRANGVLLIAFTGAEGKAKADTGALVLSRWTPKHKRITTSYDAYSLLHSVEDMLDLQPLAKAARAPAFATRVLR